MKKTLMIMLALVLVIAMSVTGTLAYLTSAVQVVNTFTYGDVEIDLTEAKVDEYGKPIANVDRVKTNKYKLIPGASYTKDPIVYFKAGSEASYLFIKVENGIKDIVASKTIEEQIVANGWTAFDADNGIYWRSATATLGDNNKDVEYKVFESFTLTENAVVESYKDATIKVTAYAVQSEGMNDEADAWSKVKDVTPVTPAPAA